MKTEVKNLVTDRIIEELENGVVAWQKPWTPGNGPRSLSTGKPYRGFNNLLLALISGVEGYEHNLWGTFKWFSEHDSKIKKGSKSVPVVFWQPIEKENENGEINTFLLTRYYRVFNIAQTDFEVPQKYITDVQQTPDVRESVQRALAYQGGPAVHHVESDRAFYESTHDTITLPLKSQFTSESSYAATALHEIVHSTGHKSRLNRLDNNARFGCESYAAEELVAEIGSAFLAAELGVEVEYDNTAAYVQSWLKVLKDDRNLIIQAAQKAQKAVDHVLGETIETTGIKEEAA